MNNLKIQTSELIEQMLTNIHEFQIEMFSADIRSPEWDQIFESILDPLTSDNEPKGN